LALGKVHLLAGSPGAGKTTIAVSLAAAITARGQWPYGGAVEAGNVLIWSAEDGIADTLMPRFLAAGGVKERVHFAGGVQEHGTSRPFDPAAENPSSASTGDLCESTAGRRPSERTVVGWSTKRRYLAA
jgi:putative DNA primase/helicase